MVKKIENIYITISKLWNEKQKIIKPQKKAKGRTIYTYTK